MPSAKIVAQKPAGSVNPLSSLGQAWLVACAARFDGLWAWTSEITTPVATSTTTADNKVLNDLDDAMKPPVGRQRNITSCCKGRKYNDGAAIATWPAASASGLVEVAPAYCTQPGFS